MALNRIWKFKLKRTDRQTVQLPADYSVLSVGKDPNGDLCIWVAVNHESPARGVEFCVVGTGNSLPHVGDFIGTVNDGPFVWHVFTGPADAANALEGFHYQTKGNPDGR
jgi:hypothetical protein